MDGLPELWKTFNFVVGEIVKGKVICAQPEDVLFPVEVVPTPLPCSVASVKHHGVCHLPDTSTREVIMSGH